jgi:uncharacterized PurR-regulated membrane protein YhhQ (DUF165 family)
MKGTHMNKGYLWVVAYIATIFGANWAIENHGFVPVGFGLEAPAGVYFAGAAFTFRDMIHRTVGAGWSLLAIGVGAFLSWYVSPAFAIASGVAFGVSELIDFAVYTPLWRRRWLTAVVASNIAGLVVDSALFLYLAFDSIDFIEGQIIGKAWVTLLAVIALWIWRRGGSA